MMNLNLRNKMDRNVMACNDSLPVIKFDHIESLCIDIQGLDSNCQFTTKRENNELWLSSYFLPQIKYFYNRLQKVLNKISECIIPIRNNSIHGLGVSGLNI